MYDSTTGSDHFPDLLQVAEREMRACLAALARSHRQLIFCSLTALKILGMVIPQGHDLPDDEIHACVKDPRFRSKQQGVRFHVWKHSLNARFIAMEDAPVGGIRVVDPLTACLQMLAHCHREEAVVMFDALMSRQLGRRLADAATIEDRLRTMGAFHGKTAGEWAFAHSREGVDSPMETRIRLRLVASGFPCPQVNFRLTHPSTNELWFFDLAYPELRMAFEYQGEEFHLTRSGLRRDSRKISAVQGLDWRIITITWGDYADAHAWRRLVDTIRQVIRRQRRHIRR